MNPIYANFIEELYVIIKTKGMCQGNIIPPKIFATVLESLYNRRIGGGRIYIDEELAVIFAKNSAELQTKIVQLQQEPRAIPLETNMSMTE
ncbi:unnamed protein product [Soboliphyme baturini]|uniref:Reverse transcriptase domain-containing protein n=1 Tax=Soboliphyme baturini TaxID=241478 RepID=A0A183J6C2_9BILA|nr:unnamed protein product [Soboliphyme baturini]